MTASSAPPNGIPPGAESIGVLTLNVQRAAPPRARRQVDWLAGRPDADVVLLTEVPARGSGHEDLLAERGYQVTGPPPGNDYRVLIAARVGRLRPAGGHTGRWSHRLVRATLRLPGRGPLGIAGIYVPSRGPYARRNADKRAFQDAVVAALPRLSAELDRVPMMVAGDLNVVEPGHEPPQAVFGRWEYDFYRSFADHGLTDVYRRFHPRLVEHSWYGRSGRGYRIDHMFTDTSAITLGCRYLHEPRGSGLSDHSALTATVLVPPAAVGTPTDADPPRPAERRPE